ncbi:unnamed protein product, partial [Phaeothamnion confervicola]
MSFLAVTALPILSCRIYVVERRIRSQSLYIIPAASSAMQRLQLELYALYKQAMLGDCPNVPRPGVFEPKKRAKHDAWFCRRGMPKNAAMREYSHVVQREFPGSYEPQSRSPQRPAAGQEMVTEQPAATVTVEPLESAADCAGVTQPSRSGLFSSAAVNGADRRVAPAASAGSQQLPQPAARPTAPTAAWRASATTAAAAAMAATAPFAASSLSSWMLPILGLMLAGKWFWLLAVVVVAAVAAVAAARFHNFVLYRSPLLRIILEEEPSSPPQMQKPPTADPVAALFGIEMEAVAGDHSVARTADGATNPATAAATTKEPAVVFLTGATGFVGRMVLRDVLLGRGTGGAPVKELLVLVRPRRGQSAAARLQRLRADPMFAPLVASGAWCCSDDSSSSGGGGGNSSKSGGGGGNSSKSGGGDGSVDSSASDGGGGGGGCGRCAGEITVTAIEGDLAEDGLGLGEAERARLCARGITHAIHCAASVNFALALPAAATANVAGTLRVAALAASWPRCRIMCHVSTAFVHGAARTGSATAPLLEALPDLGGADAWQLYRSALRGNRSAEAAMTRLGHSNPYTFTKALAEHLLARGAEATAAAYAAETAAAVLDGSGTGVIADRTAPIAAAAAAVRRGPMRVVICRPSIIGPSWIYPWPGWVGESASPVTACLLLSSLQIRAWHLGTAAPAIVPCDVASFGIVRHAFAEGIAAAAAVAREGGSSSFVAGLALPDALMTAAAVAAAAAAVSAAKEVAEAADATEDAVVASPPVFAQRSNSNSTGDGPSDSESGSWVDTDREEASLASITPPQRALSPPPPPPPPFSSPPPTRWRAVPSPLRAATPRQPPPPAVVIKNLAWRPNASASLRSSDGLSAGGGGGAPGEMPSFLRLGNLFCHYQILRGRLSPLVASSAMALAAVTTSPRRFRAMHAVVNGVPVGIVRAAAAAARWLRRLSVLGCGTADGGGGNGGLEQAAQLMASLVRLPVLYGPFSGGAFFFASDLTLPAGFEPDRYALEVFCHTELLGRRYEAKRRRCGSSGDSGGSGGSGKADGSTGPIACRHTIVSELRVRVRALHARADRCNGCGLGGEDADYASIVHRRDCLLPWPSLAWWAATLPCDGAGGVSGLVRAAAFVVRAVLARAVDGVFVDVSSFRAAAPRATSAAAPAAGAAATAPDDAVGRYSGENCRGDRCSFGSGSKCGGGSGGGNCRARRSCACPLRVVLLPTHRSFLDFVLVSLLCAAPPDTGLEYLRMPCVAAAGDFADVRLLGWLMRRLGAFFVRRGSTSGGGGGGGGGGSGGGDSGGNGNSGSKGEFSAVSSTDADAAGALELCLDDLPPARPVEVFLEGTRSRDGRFLRPRTGLLRALQRRSCCGCRNRSRCGGGGLWLVPVTVSLEAVPEAAALRREAAGAAKAPLSLAALAAWVHSAMAGRIRLGTVHIRAGRPLLLDGLSDARAAAAAVQHEQRRCAVVTPYHVDAAAADFGIPATVVETAIAAAGGTVRLVHSRRRPPQPLADGSPPPAVPAAAADDARSWTAHQAWLHLLAPRVLRAPDMGHWMEWLLPGGEDIANGGSDGASGGSSGDDEGRYCSDKNGRPRKLVAAQASADAAECAAAAASSVDCDDGDEDAACTSAECLQLLLTAVLARFEAAEAAAREAVEALRLRGFAHPAPAHVRQCYQVSSETELAGGSAGAALPVPPLLVEAAAALLFPPPTPDAATVPETVSREDGDGASCADPAAGWFGAAGDASSLAAEAFGAWGFADSGFQLLAPSAAAASAASTRPAVFMKGSRYGICGRPLPGLLPFFEAELGVRIDPRAKSLPQRAAAAGPCPLPRSALLSPVNGLLLVSSSSGDDGGGSHEGGSCGDGSGGSDRGRGRNSGTVPETLLQSLLAALAEEGGREGQVSISDRERWRHGSGHSLGEVYTLRAPSSQSPPPPRSPTPRMPDAVVYPETERQVATVLAWAAAANACVVPFGGGTNVSGALRCPARAADPRPVISLDMRRMDAVLELDAENLCVHVQAGAVGAALARALAARGLTLGHEPDSIEFSTVGGWIATRASGMKRARYGNIEDMLLEVRVATPRGVLWQHRNRSAAAAAAAAGPPFARTSTGLELCDVLLGSEGGFGVVTSAMLRLWPLPEVSTYGSAVFPSLVAGVAFCRDLAQGWSATAQPASCRLVDNAQLRLGRCIKGNGGSGGGGERWGELFSRLVEAAFRAWLFAARSWSPSEVAGATFVFEGSAEEVALQRAVVR